MSDTPFASSEADSAADKTDYFYEVAPDYEHLLSKMSLSELASELQRTQNQQATVKTIMVEHMLATKLARIQSHNAWWSKIFNAFGAILAALIAFYCGYLFAVHNAESNCIQSSWSEQPSPQAQLESKVPELKERLLQQLQN